MGASKSVTLAIDASSGVCGSTYAACKQACVEEILDLMREGKFKDTPMEPLTWNWESKQESLVKAVQGTLEGFRSGKGIFLFGET